MDDATLNHLLRLVRDGKLSPQDAAAHLHSHLDSLERQHRAIAAAMARVAGAITALEPNADDELRTRCMS